MYLLWQIGFVLVSSGCEIWNSKRHSSNVKNGARISMNGNWHATVTFEIWWLFFRIENTELVYKYLLYTRWSHFVCTPKFRIALTNDSRSNEILLAQKIIYSNKKNDLILFATIFFMTSINAILKALMKFWWEKQTELKCHIHKRLRHCVWPVKVYTIYKVRRLHSKDTTQYMKTAKRRDDEKNTFIFLICFWRDKKKQSNH